MVYTESGKFAYRLEEHGSGWMFVIYNRSAGRIVHSGCHSSRYTAHRRALNALLIAKRLAG